MVPASMFSFFQSKGEKSGVSFPSLCKYSSANKLRWEGSSLCGRGRCYSHSYFFLSKNKAPKSEDEKTKCLSTSVPPGASCHHRGHLFGAESSWSASVHCFQICPDSHPPFTWSPLIHLQVWVSLLQCLGLTQVWSREEAMILFLFSTTVAAVYWVLSLPGLSVL